MKAKMLIVALLAAITLPLVGCDNNSSTAATTNGKKVVVASKNFTEAVLIGEMYAQLLEANGIPVDKTKINLNDTAPVHAALIKGDIDLYPEYTGTGLTVILKKDVIPDAQKTYDTVKADYASQFKLTWLAYSPMNDTQAIAMKKADADALGIKTMSDFVAKSDQITLLSTAEFDTRPDGIPGIEKAYGKLNLKGKVDLENSIKYKSLADGKGNAVIAYSTDGAISGQGLLVLQDDKKLWPPYNVAPVVRDDILNTYPKIKDVLDGLAPKITNDAIATMNWQVDGPTKAKPADVAKKFLQEQGLLK